jgi:hypothetical protein
MLRRRQLEPTIMNFAQAKEHNVNIDQVRAFMRKHKLALEDLIDIGGEGSERARYVSRCWQMMARLSIRFADLEHEHADH